MGGLLQGGGVRSSRGLRFGKGGPLENSKTPLAQWLRSFSGAVRIAECEEQRRLVLVEEAVVGEGAFSRIYQVGAAARARVCVCVWLCVCVCSNM